MFTPTLIYRGTIDGVRLFVTDRGAPVGTLHVPTVDGMLKAISEFGHRERAARREPVLFLSRDEDIALATELVGAQAALKMPSEGRR